MGIFPVRLYKNWNVYIGFFLRRHYPDQVLGYDLSLCTACADNLGTPFLKSVTKLMQKVQTAKFCLHLQGFAYLSA